MNLLAKEAAAVKTEDFLDFAHFDCAACHQDLKYPSDRQSRSQGVPGRPLMKTQTELLMAVLDHASNQDGTSPKLNAELRTKSEQVTAKLHKVDSRPLATRRDHVHAGELASPATRSAELNAIDYTPEVSKSLLSRLTGRLGDLGKKDARSNYLDHDSAQQLTWPS